MEWWKCRIMEERVVSVGGRRDGGWSRKQLQTQNTVFLGLQLLYSFQGVLLRKKSASQTDLKLAQTRDQNKRGIERSIQMKSNQVYTYSFACSSHTHLAT